MYFKTIVSSPVGELTLASDGENLIGLWLEGQKYHGGKIANQWEEKNDLAIFKVTEKWLKDYFSNENPNIKGLPLAPQGSEFQKEVWSILCDIPYGEVISYGEIAKEIAKKQGKTQMSAQAVGGAVGHNPISIIIPCHRVVGSNGSLTGYAGGIEKKTFLLEFEGVDITKLWKPKKGTAL
jgi:O-6-methylguanine DNA methyltransferase